MAPAAPALRALVGGRQAAVGELLVDLTGQQRGARGGLRAVGAERLQALPVLPLATADLRAVDAGQRLQVRFPEAIREAEEDEDRHGHDDGHEGDRDVAGEAGLRVAGATTGGGRGACARCGRWRASWVGSSARSCGDWSPVGGCGALRVGAAAPGPDDVAVAGSAPGWRASLRRHEGLDGRERAPPKSSASAPTVAGASV